MASRRLDWEQSLAELERLAETAGAVVVGKVIQHREKPEPATFIGKGKAIEAKDIIGRSGASLAIADADLTPVQQRNLERELGVPTIDRTGLILDIFAQRARSGEGKLQVELAQLTYMLPRLVGRGVLLSRLGGGIGTRGPGETKLEVDRRRIRRRIGLLKEEVKRLAKHRRVQRRLRKASLAPVASLVGYTNAGKSTLLNTLCGADVFVADTLFATLDPTVRRLTLPGGAVVLLADTVGFIRNLPTQLVAAFRATLEEVTEADMLIHVLDASRPDALDQAAVVEKVLAELEAVGKPSLTVLNKCDLVTDVSALDAVVERFRPAVAVSAREGIGLDKLKAALEKMIRHDFEQVAVTLPLDRGDLISLAHQRGQVVTAEYGDGGVRLTARVPADIAARLRAASTRRRSRAARK